MCFLVYCEIYSFHENNESPEEWMIHITSSDKNQKSVGLQSEAAIIVIHVLMRIKKKLNKRKFLIFRMHNMARNR